MSRNEPQTITAVIVDDEPLARTNVREALRPFQQWQVVGELAGGEGVLEMVQKLQPQVIFLDVQMPGASGIEVGRQLLTLEEPPLIVFVTAYDQYAIAAFELFAFDYILKPFDDERFNRTVDRIELCLAEDETRSSVRRQQSGYRDPKQPLDRLVIRSVGSIRIIDVVDVFWLRASGNYVEVGHRDGVHLQRVPLSFLEDHLDPNRFCRTHRSAIVALNEVKEYRHGSDDSGQVITRDGTEIPVSASYRSALFEKLGID